MQIKPGVLTRLQHPPDRYRPPAQAIAAGAAPARTSRHRTEPADLCARRRRRGNRSPSAESAFGAAANLERPAAPPLCVAAGMGHSSGTRSECAPLAPQ